MEIFPIFLNQTNFLVQQFGFTSKQVFSSTVFIDIINEIKVMFCNFQKKDVFMFLQMF